MNDKKCQKCGKEGLGWSPEDQSQSGRWRLWDHENNVAHEEKCTMKSTFSTNSPKWRSPTRFKANMYEKCPYCDGFFLKSEGNEQHIETLHKDKVVHCGIHIVGHNSGKHWVDEIWPTMYLVEKSK